MPLPCTTTSRVNCCATVPTSALAPGTRTSPVIFSSAIGLLRIRRHAIPVPEDLPNRPMALDHERPRAVLFEPASVAEARPSGRQGKIAAIAGLAEIVRLGKLSRDLAQPLVRRMGAKSRLPRERGAAAAKQEGRKVLDDAQPVSHEY